MSANEKRAAGGHRERYHLYFVSECLTERPSIDVLINPIATLARVGELVAVA